MKTYILISALVALIASTNGLPRRIKRLNNALGIPKESEVLWDILDIGNLTLKVDGFESLLADYETALNERDDLITIMNYNISTLKAEIFNISTDLAEATRCTAVDWSWNCCTTANPCSLGKGDCNSDSECGGDLICGVDNCQRDFGFGHINADCCIDASMLRHHVSEECTCQTMTITLNGTVVSHQGGRAGDYQESVMVNGHPSWINRDHAIWYADGMDDWVVGSIGSRGKDISGIQAVGQGTTCPNSIASTNWDYWNGSSWISFNSSSVISVSCSQAKVLNGEVHGANSTMAHESDEIRNED